MGTCKVRYVVSSLFFLIIGLWVFVAPTLAATELRPDLQAFPAFNLNIITDASGHKLLRFSTRTWNSGTGPLELRAGETTDPDCQELNPDDCKQNVYQRVKLSDGSFYNRLAGTFIWHPAHNHFHFDKYALYTLQPINAPGGSARTGAKTTFCVMDTNAINASLPGAPPQAVYSTCGAVIQGMSVGWADTYGYTLAGQSFDLTGLPSGDYSLSIEANYGGKILEANTGNNTSCMLVRLNVTNSTVQVLNANSCTYVIVSSLTPNSVSRNSVKQVTIFGAGFTPGMTVSFEGGSGQRPTASSVVVDPNSGGTKLTAYVTVSKKVKVGNWDVRVGSGVLPGGFRVQ